MGGRDKFNYFKRSRVNIFLGEIFDIAFLSILFANMTVAFLLKTFKLLTMFIELNDAIFTVGS